ncbi:hypothetical protein Trydic_g12474 [Trypoxylus dichotomus]
MPDTLLPERREKREPDRHFSEGFLPLNLHLKRRRTVGITYKSGNDRGSVPRPLDPVIKFDPVIVLTRSDIHSEGVAPVSDVWKGVYIDRGLVSSCR